MNSEQLAKINNINFPNKVPHQDQQAQRILHECPSYRCKHTQRAILINEINEMYNKKLEVKEEKKDILLKSVKNEHQQLFVWQRCSGSSFRW